MTELQVTACVFSSINAFHLTTEGPTVRPPEVFVRLTVLPLQGFQVTQPIFHDVANVANEEACTKLVD